jgi:hypothetical protein
VLWRTGGALGQPNMDFTVHIPLLRCIFGNPFRPLELPPPASLAKLAQACYVGFPEIDRERFAVLADALEERGLHEAAAHCRDSVHVKGCHVIDWARTGSLERAS